MGFAAHAQLPDVAAVVVVVHDDDDYDDHSDGSHSLPLFDDDYGDDHLQRNPLTLVLHKWWWCL